VGATAAELEAKGNQVLLFSIQASSSNYRVGAISARFAYGPVSAPISQQCPCKIVRPK
jgi:hypothetical protein